VLRIGLVIEVAVSVRRDPDDVSFATGSDPAGRRAMGARTE